MKTKAIIIEDEKPAARLLQKMVTGLRPEWEVTAVPGSIEEAVEWFGENPDPDLIFLDINLSDGKSFELLEKINTSSRIIFTTAYDEYAIQAFGVNSIDYLLKPVDRERLEKAILKFESFTGKNNGNGPLDRERIIEILREGTCPQKKYRTRFLINGTDRMETLRTEEIACFLSENKTTYAITFSSSRKLIDMSLDKLSEQLDPDRFFRTNRQTILNIDAITDIEPYFGSKAIVHTKPELGERIIVSREKVQALKQWLDF